MGAVTGQKEEHMVKPCRHPVNCRLVPGRCASLLPFQMNTSKEPTGAAPGKAKLSQIGPIVNL